MNWLRAFCPLRALFCLALWCICTVFAATTLAASQPSRTDQKTVARNLDLLPLSFEPNRGQSSSDAKFLAEGRGFVALFKAKEADFLLAHPTGTSDLLRMTLLNASRNASVAAEGRLPGTVNYFIGSDPEKWHRGISTFARLRYAGAYAGIDLIYYGHQGRMEFDFQLSPGAKPKSIRMRFEGARSVEVDRDGNLIVTGRRGTIRFEKPVVYQPAEGKERDLVAGFFEVHGKNTISFAVPEYDHTRPLIIDPILNYSTYVGSLAEATAIAVDQNGEAYVTGVASLEFPTTPDSYQPVGVPSSTSPFDFPGDGKPFVAKFNSAGTALIYSTFLSGSGVDSAAAIALDANGDVYVVGNTSSTNFPITTGAVQATNNASWSTGFVTELDNSGSSLVYSTYLGGSTYSSVFGIAVDGSGSAYVTGETSDTNFPVTSGSYQTTAPVKAAGASGSAFIAKLNPAGTALDYSTYLGGSQADGASAIAVDSVGEAYVGGNTSSNDFPVTPGSVQGSRAEYNQQAGFVTKLNASGSALVYSTYLSGDELDSLNAIALDPSGNAYVTGSTNSTNFPITAGAFQPNVGISVFGYPQTNAFVTELNSAGTALIYSTYLGGGVSLGPDADEGDEATSIALDEQGMVYLAGMACTGSFPTTAGAFEPQNLDGETDQECTAFLTKLNPAPDSPLLYSTFLGGTGDQDPYTFYGEEAHGLALDPSDNVYLAGFTHSIDFPVTPGVLQTPFTNSTEEAFVTEFNASEMKPLPIPTVTVTSNANSVLYGQPVTFTATVQPASGHSTPTGYVGFDFVQEEVSDDEGSELGFGPWTTVPLNGSGVATFTASSLVEFQTPVNAFYPGDANNAPASGTMTQTMTYVPTTTTVTSNANNVPYGTPVVFTATVLDNTGKPAVGSVFFVVGYTSYAYPGLNSNGQATWTNGTGGPALPIGTDTVTAEFIGAVGYQKSSGTVAETFTPLGTTPNPILTPPAGTYTSTQQVTLSDSNSTAVVYYTTDGTTPVRGVSAGLMAGYMISVGASETINAIAVAPGYSPSNVVSAAYTINLPPPDFSISISPQTIAVSAGGIPVATQVNISSLNGFAQPVSLSCSGLPANVTCSFEPPHVTGTSMSTLTVTASTSASLHTQPFNSPFVPAAALAAVLGCFGIRRRRTGFLALLLCTLSLVSITACGGGSSPSPSGPASTTSSVTVVGTSGSLSHSASLALTVTH